MGDGKGQQQALETPAKVLCEKCNLPVAKGQYKRVTGGGAICRDQPSCRQRVLSTELGIDLFTRYPRERTFFEMDPRPAHAKPGWKSIFTEDERVMAAWIYFSWCYPVGYAYAVQIDADDEILHDRYGKPMMMTQQRLAAFLGISQPNVNRSTKRLESRKVLRVEDGAVYPVAKPTISVAERGVVNEGEVDQLGEDPNTIPRQYRHLLNDLLAEAAARVSPDISTEKLAVVVEACTTYNEGHKDLRTTRNGVIEHVCTELASLLSRPLTFKRISSSSPLLHSKTPRPTQFRPVDDDEGIPVKELYAAGIGKGAMGKLPAKQDRAKALIAAKMAEFVGVGEDDAAERLMRACMVVATDCTVREIVAGMAEKAPLAKKKDNPVGFLVVAVPRHLAGGGLARIREKLAAAKQAEEKTAAAATTSLRERERMLAVEVTYLERLNTMGEAERWTRKDRARKQCATAADWKKIGTAAQNERIEGSFESQLHREVAAQLSKRAEISAEAGE